MPEFDYEKFLIEVKVYMIRNHLDTPYVCKILNSNRNHVRKVLTGYNALTLRNAILLAQMADLSLDRFIKEGSETRKG